MDTYWVPGVNHLGSHGRWAFAEFCDVYEIESDFEKKEESQFEKMIDPFLTGRVESNGRLSPIPLLPLVKPDLRISRIRLSCKHFVIGASGRVPGGIGSGSSLSGGGISFGCAGSGE